MKSDFEKLLFAESYIKELKRLAEKDAAYIKELEELNRELTEFHPLTSEEKIEIKRGEIYETLRRDLRKARHEIRKLNKIIINQNNDIISLKLKL